MFISRKIYKLHGFCIFVECLLFTQIYYNRLLVFLEVWVIQQTAGFIFVLVTSSNRYKISVYFYDIFYWLIENVATIDHNVVVFISTLGR